jgi:hypothetical protein
MGISGIFRSFKSLCLFIAVALFAPIIAANPANAAVSTFSCPGGGSYTVNNGVLEDMYSNNCSGDVVLDSSVTQINYATYVLGGVTSIGIPAETTLIEYQPFTGGSGIAAINVDIANPNYKSIDGVLYNKTGTTLKQYPAAKTGSSFTIPAAVTEIASYAFSCVNFLETLIIPDTVITADYIDRINGCNASNISQFIVGAGNPNYSSVDGVLFNKNVTSILAYPNNKPGASYVMPSTVTTVTPQALGYSTNSQLQSITLSPNLTTIATYSFSGLNLQTLNIPASVDTIDDLGLWGVNSITLETGNTSFSMEDGVLFNFNKTKLIYYPWGSTRTTYTLPSTVTEIATYAVNVYGNPLERLTIGSTLTSVGSYNDIYTLKYLSISEDTTYDFNNFYFTNLISVNYCGTNATTIANIDAKLSSWNNASRVCLATPAFTLSSNTKAVDSGATVSGYTINSTGGAISSYEILPAIENTPGLTFSTQTGLISGTPTTAASEQTYVISARNLVGTTSQSFSITVNLPPIAPAFTISTATENATAATAITGFTIISTGGAIASYSVSPAIDNGLSFDSTSGLISGTPTNAAASKVYTITGTNRTGTASATFTIQVARSAAQIAADLERQRIAEAIEAQRIAALLEAQRVAAEAKRIADAAAAAEAKRLADEAEAKRIADAAAAAEAKRLADEAEAKRIADAAAAAEAKRLADEAEAKRIADLALEAKRIADAAAAAETKRLTDLAAEAKRIADAKAKVQAQLDAQRAALTGTKKVASITKVAPKKAVVKLVNLKPGTKVKITIKTGKK